MVGTFFCIWKMLDQKPLKKVYGGSFKWWLVKGNDLFFLRMQPPRMQTWHFLRALQPAAAHFWLSPPLDLANFQAPE